MVSNVEAKIKETKKFKEAKMYYFYPNVTKLNRKYVVG